MKRIFVKIHFFCDDGATIEHQIPKPKRQKLVHRELNLRSLWMRLWLKPVFKFFHVSSQARVEWSRARVRVSPSRVEPSSKLDWLKSSQTSLEPDSTQAVCIDNGGLHIRSLSSLCRPWAAVKLTFDLTCLYPRIETYQSGYCGVRITKTICFDHLRSLLKVTPYPSFLYLRIEGKTRTMWNASGAVAAYFVVKRHLVMLFDHDWSIENQIAKATCRCLSHGQLP